MGKDIIPGIFGAVLSGGKSSRMGGGAKALLPFRGRPLIARALDVVREAFGEAAIIANDPSGYEALGARIIPDIVPDKGPLGGIHAALAGGGGLPVFAAACDMPFLDGDLARALALEWKRAGRGAVIPRAGGRLEPLCAVYGPDLAEPLGSFLLTSEYLSVRAFLATVETRVLEISGGTGERMSFANINCPEDLERLS